MNVKNKLIYIAMAIITIIATFIVYPLYYNGDIFFYNKFYNEAANYNIYDAFIFYKNTLGTSEPVYFIITYIFSDYINKNLLVIVINVLFSYLIVRLIIKNNIKISIVFFIFAFFCCYYILVLLISAERLKLSLVFFLIGLNCNKNTSKYFWFSIAILTHTQTILLALAFFNYSCSGRFIRSLKIRKKSIPFLFIGCFIISIITTILYPHLMAKYHAYASFNKDPVLILISVTKVSVFFILSLFLTKKHLEVFLIFIPYTLASIVLGEERIIIFCFFSFCYFLVRYKSKLKYLIYLPFFFYYGYLSYHYLLSIFVYGNGFYELY